MTRDRIQHALDIIYEKVFINAFPMQERRVK